MASVRRITLGGKDVIVSYMDNDFEPAEPEEATLMKIIYPDGTHIWAEPQTFGGGENNKPSSISVDS